MNQSQSILPLTSGGIDHLKTALNAKLKKKRSLPEQRERKTAQRLAQKIRRDDFFDQMIKVNELPDLTPRDGTESSDSDVTILNVQQSGLDFTFLPLTFTQRKAVCDRVSLIMCKTNIPHCQVGEKLEMREPHVSRIKGDRNCLFRGLCMAVTGWETGHLKLRQLVCDHIDDVGPYNSKNASEGPQYLEDSGMRHDTVYGTDVEIFSTAQVLSTDIYVYHKYDNNGLKWLYIPCVHSSGNWKNTIYLDNQTGNGITGHFDYVTELK